MSIWSGQPRESARRATFVRIDASSSRHVPEPDTCYISGVLRSFRLRGAHEASAVLSSFVHSRVRLGQLDGSVICETVAAPDYLRSLDPKHLDRVLQLDRPLFGPFPFRGGGLELETGLFSVKTRDLTAPFLEILDSVASVAGVAAVGVPVALGSCVARGLELLAADGNMQLRVGLSKTFATPQQGTYVVADLPQGRVDTYGWTLSEDGELIDASSRTPVTDAAFLAFEIGIAAQRADWYLLPDVQRAHTLLRESAARGSRPDAIEALGGFRRTVLASADLIQDDALELYRRAKSRTERALPAGPTGSSATTDIGELKDLRLYE